MKVVLTHSFKQSVKRLGKRFRHVKEDVRTAIEALERTPHLGVQLPGGFEVRKLRVANSDLAKGKSGATACPINWRISRSRCSTCCCSTPSPIRKMSPKTSYGNFWMS